MLVTRLVSQPPTSWLKTCASLNNPSMFVTRLTFQRERSWSKNCLLVNNPSMFVTSDVSQSGMSMLHATPQLAPRVEQQFWPEDTMARQFSTAIFKTARLRNPEATPPSHT